MKETKKAVPDSHDRKGFRLLGILTGNRPSKEEIEQGCKDYFKVLKENTYYPFYSCFSYKNDNGVQTLTYHPEKDIDLYSADSDTQTGQKYPSIHISAIVGKNGAGKSTLLELLYLASYHIGVAGGVLNDPETGKRIKAIKHELSVDVQFFFLRNSNQLAHIQMFNNSVAPRISTYDVDNIIYLNNLAEKLGNENRIKDITKDHLKELFYSVAVNYSIYGLNVKALGNWINALFHKNDGYQTPLVINPMREEGNFDINREDYLASNRFLTNFLSSNDENHNKVTENQTIEGFAIKLDNDKVKYVGQEEYVVNGKKKIQNISFNEFYEYHSNELKAELQRKDGEFWLFKLIYIGLFDINEDNISSKNYQRFFKERTYASHVKKYILKKIYRISFYDRFKEYRKAFYHVSLKQDNIIPVQRNTFHKNDEFFLKYLSALKNDDSHITLKLKQAINYLKFGTLPTLQKGNHKVGWNLSLDDLREHFVTVLPKNDMVNNLMSYLPPSIFNIEILISNKSQGNSKFSDLSSGEQQQIHSVQSILYHLRNLNSVFLQENSSQVKSIEYACVNIVLDEIELYAHPEMQRKFIDDLIKGIRRLKLEHIEGINILLATHSPFILSDIPAQNILRLKLNEEGKSEPQPMKEQTFGANIHDLLANDFFLKDGFIGEFAKEKIQDVICFLNHAKLDKTISNLKNQLDKAKDDEKGLIKAEISRIKKQKKLLSPLNSMLNPKKCHSLISMIGESVIRETLLGQYNEIFGQEKESNEDLFLRLAKELNYTIKRN